MHQPYEQRLGHQADFRVKYRFYKPEEGGRKTLPYHSDFWYEYADSDENKFISYGLNLKMKMDK